MHQKFERSSTLLPATLPITFSAALVKSRVATWVVVALLLTACAPFATQQSPSEPSAGPQSPEHEQTTPESTETTETGTASDPVPAPEPAKPVASSEDVPGQDKNMGQPDSIDEPTSEPEAEVLTEKPPEEPVAETPEATTTAENRGPDLDLSGRIILTGGDADPTDAIVYFVPESANTRAGAGNNPEIKEIVTRDKVLSPTVLAVSRGTEVRFPNEDPILHNLFSVSAGNDFDLGVYGPQEAPSVTFEQPGIVNIYCNVHHNMHAHVLVVDTPFRTRVDTDGHFRLTGLPAGPGELHIWHRQSDRWSRSIELLADGRFEINLEVSKPSLPPHRDKTGQSYSRRDRDPYR